MIDLYVNWLKCPTIPTKGVRPSLKKPPHTLIVWYPDLEVGQCDVASTFPLAAAKHLDD